MASALRAREAPVELLVLPGAARGHRLLGILLFIGFRVQGLGFRVWGF